MGDPIKHDIANFARSFTWGLIYWNRAEAAAKLILAHLIGGSKEALAVVIDLGNRGVVHGIEAALWEITDPFLAEHLPHFLKGFGTLLGYRNLYVHNIKSVDLGGKHDGITDLIGYVNQVRGEGRMKTVAKAINLVEIDAFKEHCVALDRYANTIMLHLAESFPELKAGLGQRIALPDKPVWPASLQNIPSYHQGPEPRPQSSSR